MKRIITIFLCNLTFICFGAILNANVRDLSMMGFKFSMTIPETQKAVELNYNDTWTTHVATRSTMATRYRNINVSNKLISYMPDKNKADFRKYTVECTFVDDFNLVKLNISDTPNNKIKLTAMRDSMINNFGKATMFKKLEKGVYDYEWHFGVNGELINDIKASPCERENFDEEKCAYLIIFRLEGDDIRDFVSFFSLRAANYHDVLKLEKSLNLSEEINDPSSLAN
jgi:hypothetical protein